MLHFIGIDPGVGEAMPGGAGLITLNGNGVVVHYEATEMPRAGKLVDIRTLFGWAGILSAAAPEQRVIVAIERQHGRPEDGVSSLNVSLPAYGQLVGACQALALQHVIVQPKDWKKVVLAGTARDKPAACAHVATRWPLIDLCPGHRRKAHDGIADAMCIAEWAWREGRI